MRRLSIAASVASRQILLSALRHSSTPSPSNAPTLHRQLIAAVAALHQVTPHGSGIRIDAIDDYVKLVCGLDHDATTVLPAFRTETQALLAQLGLTTSACPSASTSAAVTPTPLSYPQAHLLAHLYFSVCARGAFLAADTFDVAGFTTFIARRLSLDIDTAISMLGTTSKIASPYVLLVCKTDAFGDHLQIGDHQADFYAAPLNFADLSSDALKDGYLRRLRLNDTHLHALNLDSTDLRDARLTRCRFTCVRFSETAMLRVHFDHCEFIGCIFDRVDFAHMRMTGCRISDSRFLQCNMRHAQWRGTELLDTTLFRCDLTGLRMLPDITRRVAQEDASTETASAWTDCRVDGCNLNNAVFLRVHAQRSTWLNGTLQRARLIDTSWYRCRIVHPTPLPARPLANTIIQNGNFTNCTLDGLDASHSIWNRTCLHGTSAVGTRFSSCTLTALDIAGACDFSRARFDRSTVATLAISGTSRFREASFRHASVQRLLVLGHRVGPSVDFSFADFSECRFDTVAFQHCRMPDALFLSAWMHDTTFRGCDLTRSNFTLCDSADLVSTSLPNRLASARFRGMIPILNAAVIDQLQDHAQRSRLLDPTHTLHDGSCLTVQIQRFPDLAVRTQLWERLTDGLLETDEDLHDIDPPTLSVLLRPEYANQGALLSYVDTRLLDHLRVFSEHGLPLGDTAAQDWRRRAVPHICRLLGTMTDAQQLREFSPLIAFLLTANESPLLSLTHQELAYLHQAQSVCLPASLSEAFCNVLYQAPFETPAHRLFITPEADHAVIVTPEAAPSLLGIVSQPVVAEHGYLHFTRSLSPFPNRNDAPWAPWVNIGNHNTVAAFAPFPRLRASLHARIESLQRLIATYRLPDTLRVPITEGFSHHLHHPLVDHDAQQMLGQVFDPLCTVIPPYPSRGARSEAAHIIAHLRPTPGHCRDVLAALARLRPDGNGESESDALGLCCIAYASLIFSGASAAIFGTEYQSPMPLRRYGMAWANYAFAVLPALHDVIPSRQGDASDFPVPVAQTDLVARSFGLDHSVSQCAALIASDLAAALQSPRFRDNPCVPSLRALIGR